MTIVGLFEAKNRQTELVDRASRGEEVVITRRGVEVARLVPPAVRDESHRAVALAQRIRQSRAQHPLGGKLSIRKLIDEGRR